MFVQHLGQRQCLAVVPHLSLRLRNARGTAVVNNGQKNKFHQSSILQLNTVVLAAAFSGSRQRWTEGSLRKMYAGEEGAIVFLL